MTRHADKTLLIGLAAGQEHAFAQLYDRFGSRMYRTALKFLGRPEDAEDVVQEVFAALVRAGSRLKQVDNLPAYLFTALRRAAAKRAIKRQNEPVTGTTDPSHVLSKSDSTQQDNPHSEQLDRALQALPEQQREVVALKIEGELTFAEIGQVLNLSSNTAASRYRYALEKLRTSLSETP